VFSLSFSYFTSLLSMYLKVFHSYAFLNKIYRLVMMMMMMMMTTMEIVIIVDSDSYIYAFLVQK
jgi:hypothetical protein